MKNLFLLILSLFVFSCDSGGDGNDDSYSLDGNWYTNDSISGDGDSVALMKCSTIAFLDNTFESSEGVSGTFTINENEMDFLIFDIPDAPEYEGEVSLCIFDIENNILSLLCNEPGNPDYHPVELLPQGAIYRNMEVTGISDCSEDLDVDGIIDTEDDCIHFDFDDEVDCSDEFGNQISCDYTCVDESDQTPNLLQITLPEASELIIILTYECSNIYNETIVDGYYTAGSYNFDINNEDLNTGFYNINVSASDFNQSQNIWICNP